MIRNYLLTAWKVFMRRKLFTAINLLCIVLTLVVLMVATALLDFAFFPSGVEGKSDRFLQITTMSQSSKDGNMHHISPVGYRTYEKHLKNLKTPEMVAAVSGPQSVSVYQGGSATALNLRRADANYWKILDFKVLAGRVVSEDDVANGRFVVVLSASTAKKLFSHDNPIGQKVDISSQVFEVIGVVEDTLHFNSYADMWAPVTTYPSSAYKEQVSGEFFVLLMAHDRGGLDAMRDEVAHVSQQVEAEDPAHMQVVHMWADSKLDVFARGILGNNDVPDSGAGVMLAIIATLMLLFMLLPALNMINLNVGRIQERHAEIGVRKAFGATNGQLVMQFVFENVLLCAGGGLVGLAMAQVLLDRINHLEVIPHLDVGVNFAVFGIGMLISLVFGLMSGVVPAWKMARLDPVNALKGNA